MTFASGEGTTVFGLKNRDCGGKVLKNAGFRCHKGKSAASFRKRKGTLSVVLRLAERYRSQYDGEECCGSNKDGETREFIRRRQSGWIWVPGNPFKRHQGKKQYLSVAHRILFCLKTRDCSNYPSRTFPKQPSGKRHL